MDTVEKVLIIECNPMGLSKILDTVRESLVAEFEGYDIYIKSVEPSLDERYDSGGYAYDITMIIPTRLYNKKRLVNKISVFDKTICEQSITRKHYRFNRNDNYRAFWK